MNARAVWTFLAGDSALAPVAVALAVIVAVVLLHAGAPAGAAGGALAFLVALGLTLSVFERR